LLTVEIERSLVVVLSVRSLLSLSTACTLPLLGNTFLTFSYTLPSPYAKYTSHLPPPLPLATLFGPPFSRRHFSSPTLLRPLILL
jgi:hypothetical protein